MSEQPSAHPDSRCPKCSRQFTPADVEDIDSPLPDIVPIVYGRPSQELLDKAEAGRVRLGGCCLSPDSPVLHCRVCQLDFKPISADQ